MVRIMNVCLSSGKVPNDWKVGCIVPLYKGKGDPLECRNSRGISLLSVPGKVYGRILIERVIENSDGQVGEEQSGFRIGRSCADQIFVLRQVCEKMRERKKRVYVAFMDLASATGGLRVAGADLAPLWGTRPTTSRAPEGRVGAGREPAILMTPRGLRSGPGNAALVTSLNNKKATAPREPTIL